MDCVFLDLHILQSQIARGKIHFIGTLSFIVWLFQRGQTKKRGKYYQKTITLILPELLLSLGVDVVEVIVELTLIDVAITFKIKVLACEIS